MRHKTRNRRISTRDSTGAISRIRDAENALHSNWVNVSGIMLNVVGKTKPCYRFAPVFTLATNTGAQGERALGRGQTLNFRPKQHISMFILPHYKFSEEIIEGNFERRPIETIFELLRPALTRLRKFPHHVRSLPPTHSTLRRRQPGRKTPTSPAVNPTIYPPTRRQRAARAQIT